MYIQNAVIYGFGKWVDETFDFTADGFLCIYGENETGKSTIQQFLTFMLFGMPPKKRAYYRPKTSGKMGGRLTVFDDDIGQFVIERFDEVENGAAVCYTSDGRSYNEDWLQERLNGMTEATYQSIFSFSALDLLDIRKMKEDELGEVLLGIGLTGSSNIYSTEKRLDAKIGELFKPFGKKPELNKKLISLDELSRSLERNRKSDAAYKDKKADIFDLTDDIEYLQAELDRAKDNVFRIEKMLEALPVYRAYQHEKEQLDSYPGKIPFPENGTERMNRLNEQLLPLKSELAVLEHNEEKYAAKRKAMRGKLYDASVYDQATYMMKQKQPYLEAQTELNKHLESIKELEVHINTELNQLNSGIRMADLETIHLPFHVEKTWNQLKNEQEQLTLNEDHLREEHQQLTKNREYLTAEWSRINASLLDESYEAALQEKMNHYERAEQLNRDVTEQNTKWNQIKAKNRKQTGLWLTGSFSLALLSGLLAVIQEQQWFFGFAVLSLAMGLWRWLSGKKNMQAIATVLRPVETGCDSVSTEEKREAQRLIEGNNNKKRELSSIDEQIRTNDIEIIKCEEKQNGHQARKNRLQERIRSQYEQYPFLKQIDITYWPELFYALKHITKLQRDKAENEKQVKKLHQDCNQYITMVDHFFCDMEWDVNSKSMADKFSVIERLLEEYRNTTIMIKQYEDWYDDYVRQKNNMKQKMRVYEQEVTSLLTTAGTETEEEFFRRGKQLSNKQEHAARMRELDDQLSQKLLKEEYDALFSDENIDESQLNADYEHTAARIERLKQTIDEKRQQKADVKAELGIMESSDTYSDTLHRFNMEQEQLNQLADEWAVYKTARELLTETKRNYRDKYLGEVIQRALHYFQTLTNNAYAAIYPPVLDKPFRVEAQAGIRYSVDELSQGTVDQLYVSLRLGISEVMSQKHRLPFIIDDAFVHFDPVRTKRMIQMLSDIAANQQVILFTCKQDIRKAASHVVCLPTTVGVNQSKVR